MTTSETAPAEVAAEAVLTVTPSATAKLAELLTQESDAERLALRVGVSPGGCSGYTYDMFFDSEQSESDNEIVLNDKVRVVIDPESAAMLRGATLDFEDGLQGAGFHLDNPNAKKSCGCGNSFC